MIENSFYLEVKRRAILKNLEVLRAWKKKDVIPVIKANAYGHGIIEMAKTCIQGGVTQVAVARYEEAKRILESPEVLEQLEENREFQVLVFESLQDIGKIQQFPRIDIAINSLEELEMLLENGVSTQRMHLKIDLGFGRNGIEIKNSEKLKKYILGKNMQWKGIFSHLFAASYEDGCRLSKIFEKLLQELGVNRFQRIHLQNSAASYNYDFPFVTDIRVGMLVYGLQEPGYYHEGLEQAFCLKGKVDSIRSLEDIHYIAYESKDDLSVQDVKGIAKIKIGYADGFGKYNENSVCLIDRKEYRIIEVTMDNTFVEIDARIHVGSEVILFYNPSILKNTTGRQIYENLTVLSDRLPRKWRNTNC